VLGEGSPLRKMEIIIAVKNGWKMKKNVKPPTK
jgi:hypothetical protein